MKFWLTILLAFTSFNLWAQYPIEQELKFAEHLVNQEEYADAIYYINHHLNGNYRLSVTDSLNYLKGWSQYSIKDLQNSATTLLNVSEKSSFFYKSRFFAAYNYSYLQQIQTAEDILNKTKTENSYTNLKNFELAGNALLKRDTKKFDQLFAQIGTSSDFAFYNEKEKLKAYSLNIKNHHEKSMFLGSMMSLFVPGSGEIYAGKTGEGIASFIIISATGATAYENYRKLGIKNMKTIFFGSLFSVLYIGNIYGTIFTVKLANEEFNQEIDHEILFNMHIPLRNLFN